jgi:replication initiation and membrane attachment protein DnaB
LGGSNALILHDTAGSASFLEYTGAGISSIADAMQEKKKEMAVLGLRILSSEQASNEGSETATIHSKGEESVLENIANSVSEALTRALKLMVEWDNPDADTEEIRVKLNTDFIPNAISANTINALTVLLKSFGISDREMFEVLKRGEILPAEMTFEEHQKQIKESMAFSMFSDLGEDSTTDFNAPVDFRRLTKPEDPGNPQAEKRPDVDPGGSQNR